MKTGRRPHRPQTQLEKRTRKLDVEQLGSDASIRDVLTHIMAVPLEYRHPPEPTVRGKPETAKLPKCTEATQSETTQQGQQSQKGDQGAAASEGPCESGQDKGEGQSGFAEEEGRVTPSPTRSPVTQVSVVFMCHVQGMLSLLTTTAPNARFEAACRGNMAK